MDLLSFILSSSYFMYSGKIYPHIQVIPMGSLVSVVVSNLYMESYKGCSMELVLSEVRFKIWKRYVDD